MKVTAILLADHATVREGLLHVLGAGITRVARDPLPARLDVALALMLQADNLDELNAGHSLEVTINESSVGSSGDLIARALMTLSAPPGVVYPGPNLQVPVVVPIQSVPVPRTGAYRITVNLDGTETGSYDFEIAKSVDPMPQAHTDSGLTAREQEVLSLVAEGRSDREIAKDLAIDERTVRAHVAHIMGKLGVTSRLEATALAKQSAG